MTEPAIRITGLRKGFTGRTVLDDIDLDVERGEIFAMLGQNGAGKTTMINILTTLMRPDAGVASVCGFDVVRHSSQVQRRISLTGQSAAVDDMLTGAENVIMFARLAGLGRRAARTRAEELIARFDLVEAASRRVRTYSGGMRRRLDLALSLVTIPEVLFLDEPTTGLDTRSRRDLWEIIRTIAAEGTTVFLTTQYLEEADQLADRIAVLHRGAIAALGDADALKAAVGGDAVEVHDEDGRLLQRIATDGSVHALRRAIDGLDEQGTNGVVTLRRPTLDDVFLALTDPESAHAVPTTMKESA